MRETPCIVKTMQRRTGWLIWTMGMAGLLACSHLPWKRPPLPDDPGGRLAYADSLLSLGKAGEAARVLSDFVIRYPTHPEAERAEALLVQAYLESGDLEEALAEADFYLRNFPRGAFYEDVWFAKIRAMWRKTPRVERDQEPTREVLAELDRFLARCRKHCDAARALRKKVVDKLAHRRYLEATVYRKLRRPEAERIYLELLLREFPESRWADSARARLEVLRASHVSSRS